MLVPETASQLHGKLLLQGQQNVAGEELVTIGDGSKLGQQGHVAAREEAIEEQFGSNWRAHRSWKEGRPGIGALKFNICCLSVEQ